MANQINAAVQAAGFPANADMSQFNAPMVWLIVFYISVLFATAQSAVAATWWSFPPQRPLELDRDFGAVSVSTVIAGFSADRMRAFRGGGRHLFRALVLGILVSAWCHRIPNRHT